MTYAYTPRPEDKYNLVVRSDNPKSGKSRDRFEVYFESKTAEGYIRSNLERNLVPTATKVRADLRWDFERGFIRFASPLAEDYFGGRA